MLTPENITKINQIIADRPFMTAAELAEKYEMGNPGTAEALLSALRRIGVQIERKHLAIGTVAVSGKELAEFRAWKANKNQPAVAPTKAAVVEAPKRGGTIPWHAEAIKKYRAGVPLAHIGRDLGYTPSAIRYAIRNEIRANGHA